MQKRKGFTLIEIIIAVAIFIIFSVTIVSQINQGRLLSKINKNRMDSNGYAQYILQTYKGIGANYIKTLAKNTGKRTVYFYFDNNEDLKKVLEGNLFKDGTYDDLISNKAVDNKKYGAYLEFCVLTKIGKDESGNDIELNNGLNHVRFYIKIVELSNSEKEQTDLVFYMGR